MRLLAAVFCLTTVLSAQSQSAPQESLLFTNVNVVDTRAGKVQPNMAVLVEQGRIRSVARFGLIDGVRGMRVINASGKYLIPGLWDMHVHTAESGSTWNAKVIYPLFLANGVTAVRDMGGDPMLLADRKQKLESGEVVGPHIFTQQRVSPPVMPRNGESQRLDWVRTLSDLPRDSYVPVAQEVSDAGGVPPPTELVSVASLAARGERSIEQLRGVLLGCSSQEQDLRQRRLQALSRGDLDAYSSLRLETISTYDPQIAHHLFLQLAIHATWQVPTLLWSQTMARLDDPTLAVDPRLAYVPAALRSGWDPKLLLRQLSNPQFAGVKKEAARDLELAGAMNRTGVQFMTGSDAPDPYVVPGFSLHDEMEWMVKSGFTATQALQAATFNPALFMVKLDQYGMVEKDHVADLVLLDDNPLQDIRNTRKISAVILGGKYFSRADLDKMMLEVKEQAAKD